MQAAYLLTAAVIFAADGPKTFEVSEYTFPRPEEWKWVQTESSMRKAVLHVGDADGAKAAEVVFYYFGPGGAGGRDANVERWLSQFVEARDQINPKVDQTEMNGTAVTFVQAEGTYKSGLPGRPPTLMKDYRLLGAIIEGKKGAVFVKMTGPKEVVHSSVDEFKNMIVKAVK